MQMPRVSRHQTPLFISQKSRSSTLSTFSFFSEHQPALTQVFLEGNVPREKFRSTVIIVPELDARPVTESWQDGWNNCWLQTRLPNSIEDPCIFVFEQLSIGPDFTWRKVVEWGDILLESLLQQHEKDVWFSERPMFFFAHGLGGIVLKRALGVLFERSYDPPYRPLISAATGIVFLGTPNPKISSPRDLEQVTTLLKAICKNSRKAINKAAKLSSIAATISQKFCNCGIDALTLSVYETKLSKVRKNFFSRRQILVDRSISENMTKRERLLGVDYSHDQLCSISSGCNLENEIALFTALALQLREFRKPEVTPLNSSLDNLVPRSSDDFNDEGQLEERLPLPLKFLDSFYNDSLTVSTPCRTPKLPCYIFGPNERNPDFQGRDAELQALENQLLPMGEKKNRLKSYALCGASGLGKTQIALQFISKHKKRFDAIFWVDAKDNVRLAEGFAIIAVRLGLQEHSTAGNQDVTRNLVLQWLSSSIKKKHDASLHPKWLLVFDNAVNLPDLERYRPVGGNGSVLVTSRDPLAKTQAYFFSQNAGMDLEPFSTSESAAWLRNLTKYDQNKNDIERSELIVQQLSNNPLAISQVAGAILRHNLSFSEFLGLYTQESFRARIYQNSYYGHGDPILTTFAFNELSPGSASLLSILCFFNPDSISETLFFDFLSQSDGTVTDFSNDFPTDMLSFINARADLLRASLLRRNSQLQEVSVYGLVQDAVICSNDPKSLAQAFHIALRILSLAWPLASLDSDAAHRKKCAVLYTHISHLVSKYKMSQTLQENSEQNIEFGRLLAAVELYQVEIGESLESSELHQLTQNLKENATKSD